MKAATLFLALLLCVLLPGAAHGQCQIQTFTNYAVSFSAAPNSTGTDILTTVVLDGSASMWMQSTGCPDSIVSAFNNNKHNVPHTPSVLNQVGLVGGWSAGPSVCAECYISYQTYADSGPLSPGQSVTFTSGAQVNCGMAGVVFFPLENILAGEIAYTRSLNTGILAGTTTVNGQSLKVWRILPYCSPVTSPPDWNPSLYYAPASLPSTAVEFIDGIAACVRINVTGAPWFCTPGASIGWPQSLNLAPAASCTHNP